MKGGRRGLFTARGRVAVFKASTPHDHGVGRGRFACPLSSARPLCVLHAPGVASGGGGKPGHRWLGQRVGRSRFPAPLVSGLVEWGSRAPTPLLYKEREGGWHPAFFYLLSPPTSTSSSHPPWRRGIPVPRRWRRGSPLDNASLLLLSPRWWNRLRGEGGGGKAVGEAGAEAVALGEEEDRAARRPCPRQ